MRIAVTGGTGFLGRHLVEALVRDKHEVRFQGRKRALGQNLAKSGAQFRQLELGDSEGLNDLCRDQDIVFHCAARSSPWGPYAAFFADNVIGTQNVVDACLANGRCRLIHVSTPAIYFDGRDHRDIHEHDPLPSRSFNAYAATKLEAETRVDAAVAKGLNAVTLRPRAIFGPHDNAILGRIIRLAEKRSLPLFKGGNALIDVTYVDNVVAALMSCISAPDTCVGEKYNITNGQNMRVIDLFNLLFAALNKNYTTRATSYALASGLVLCLEAMARLWPKPWEPPFTRYTLALIAKDQTLDISAAKNALAYQPKISIEEGLLVFARWWELQHA